jgi:poly(3-hydroxybutyrate) depolymerase
MKSVELWVGSRAGSTTRGCPLALACLVLVACSDDGTTGLEGETDTDPTVASSSTGDGTTGAGTQSSESSESEGSDGSDGSTGMDEEPEIPIPDHSPGCGESFTDDWLTPHVVFWGEETVRATVQASGVEREFLLEIPSTYDPDEPHPIVFTFHGFGANMENAFGENVADYWPEAIAIYPQALPNAGGTNSWSFDPNGQDAAFFVAMINEIGSRMCLDMHRVFVQGTSQGGMMANFLGCARGNIVDGVVASASSFPLPPDSCTGPMPALLVHGRADNVVSFASGEQARDAWLSINGCSGSGAPLGDRCTMWTDCSADAPVVWCPHDGGHVIPQDAGLIDEVYAFFQSL